MEALAARGEVAEALAAYERLRVLLRDELGTAPGEAVRALHERLLTGEAPPAAPPRRARRRTGSPTGSRSRWPRRGSAATRRCAGCASAAERAAAGETGLVLVTGEGGIGKTRLVAELAHRMPGFEVLYGRCDEEELFPFGPWIDMLRPRLARMPQAELAELVARRARAGPAAAGDPRAPARTSPACRRWASPRRSAARCSAPSWRSCAGSPRTGPC